MTVTIGLWALLGLSVAATLLGFAAGVLAVYRPAAPAPGSTPPPRGSHPLPGAGSALLLEPAASPMLARAAWQPAAPPILGDQRGQLNALEREVNELAAEAWRLYRR